MFCRNNLFTTVCVGVASFGLGSLLALFLPPGILVVIQAAVIVAFGVFYIIQKK